MKTSKSSLFLMELTISILFFAVASAVCIQLFVKAHLLDIRTQTENQTVVWTQNLAELWYAYDGDMHRVYERLCKDNPAAADCGAIYLTNSENAVILYFNDDWDFSNPAGNASDSGAITYIVSCSEKEISNTNTSGLLGAVITVEEAKEVIYELPLTQHIPVKGGDIHG